MPVILDHPDVMPTFQAHILDVEARLEKLRQTHGEKAKKLIEAGEPENGLCLND